MKKLRNLVLAKSYLVLFALLLLFFGLSVSNSEYLRNLGLNAFTEVSGILITLLLIERVLESNRVKENQKRARIGILQIRSGINKQFQLFKDIERILNGSKTNQESLGFLKTDDFFTNMKSFNFALKANVYPERKWCLYIHESSIGFISSLDSILLKYGEYFDSNIIEIIEKIRTGTYSSIIKVFPSLYSSRIDLNLSSSEEFYINIGSDSKEYVNNLFSLLELCTLNSDNNDLTTK